GSYLTARRAAPADFPTDAKNFKCLRGCLKLVCEICYRRFFCLSKLILESIAKAMGEKIAEERRKKMPLQNHRIKFKQPLMPQFQFPMVRGTLRSAAEWPSAIRHQKSEIKNP
ncbi:MAG: hypothetical protein AAF998_27260, partial [Bacteroidota bacterium]